MSSSQCENCQAPVTEAEKTCSFCSYPQHGSKQEKIRFNAKLIKLKDTLEDSDKSVKGMLSFGIIFLFAAFITALFSLIFKENHYQNALLFIFIACVYFLLSRVGKKTSYLMAVLALIFYLSHTIFELQNGMYLKSTVDLSESFVESKGTSVIFALMPFVYMFFRISLIIVLIRFLLIELKLKKYSKQVQFLRQEAKKTNKRH